MNAIAFALVWTSVILGFLSLAGLFFIPAVAPVLRLLNVLGLPLLVIVVHPLSWWLLTTQFELSPTRHRNALRRSCRLFGVLSAPLFSGVIVGRLVTSSASLTSLASSLGLSIDQVQSIGDVMTFSGLLAACLAIVLGLLHVRTIGVALESGAIRRLATALASLGAFLILAPIVGYVLKQNGMYPYNPGPNGLEYDGIAWACLLLLWIVLYTVAMTWLIVALTRAIRNQSPDPAVSSPA